jgi:hypothetical protein
MLALSCQNCFVSVDWLVLNHKYNVGEGWVINYCSHVADKAIHSLVVNFVFFKFSDIQYAYVVEPFATIKTAKDK